MDPTLDKLNAVVDNLELVNKNIDGFNDFIKQSAPLLGGGSLATNIYNSRETGNELSVDEVIGREKDKEQVLKWLKESQGYDTIISALNIWGIGGVGKTTLAQSLYNDDQDLKDFFQVKMWVCVSNNNINMAEIMKKAVESATGNSRQSNIMSTLQKEVKNIVSSKKFLLVLDDVWDDQNNQNSQEWEKFIGLLSKHAEKGSKILITSRNQSVAENILKLIPIKKKGFQLGCLQEKESLTLFNKHAFAGANPNQHMDFRPIGEGIARKCGGLPLALKIIGGTLNTKLDIAYWMSILKKGILHLEEGNYDLMAVLKYSYRSLPSNLQPCFRMCSLFPQDYVYEENKLVALWMAAGYIIQNENKLPEDIGRDYLNILVMKSFFISKGERRYVMHDLLHDLARDVSKGECLRVEENNTPETLPKTLRYLFVAKLNPNLIEKLSGLKKLRTLSLNLTLSSQLSDDSFHDLDDLLKHLTSLRALLFFNVKSMPNLNAIGNLIHLRIFRMHGDYILDKPFKPLYKLYHLQNLKCNGSYPQEKSENLLGSELDGNIGNLIKLRHLNLPDLVFKRITQVRHLTELQELMLEMNEENELQFSDLKDLNMLCNVTIIYDREVGISVEEAGLANLKEKKHLLSLSLQLNKLDPQLHEQIINCLQPPSQSTIKKLEIQNYKGMESISWMNVDFLPYVSDIQLNDCPNLKHLPPLGELPCLRVLSLTNIPCVTQLGSHFIGSNETIRGFPSLEVLEILNMDSFEEWTGADIAGWFPRLKKLIIQKCKCLKELPSLPVSLKGLTLESVGLIAVPAWQDSNFPALEVLRIIDCEELVKCDQLSLSNCVFLKDLRILDCPKLSSINEINSQNQPTSSPSLDTLIIKGCNGLIVAAANQHKATSFVFNVKKVELDSLSLLQMEPLRSITSAEELTVEGDKQSSFFPHQWLLQNRTSLRRLVLKELVIMNLPSLELLPEMPSSLIELSINDCPELGSLPDKMPRELTRLSIKSCPLVESLPEMPSTLINLSIDNFPLLKSMPEMPSSLKNLCVICLPLLKSLPDMPSSLIKLLIVNCGELGSLPNKMPSKLTKLTIKDCPLLAKRCKKDEGLDWPKIAHVPNIKIR